MHKLSLLVADGDAAIRAELTRILSDIFQRIDCAADGISALKLFRRHEYHLVILDTVLPEVDGRSVCRQIRKMSYVPVMVVSARAQLQDRLNAYEFGAEDYLIKPFAGAELKARALIILRRWDHAPAIPVRNLAFAGIFIDTVTRGVFVEDWPVTLTPKEYDLLLLLARNAGRVYSRDMLLRAIWGNDFYGSDRTVDTHIKTLRYALRPHQDRIVTVRGVGYKFEG